MDIRSAKYLVSEKIKSYGINPEYYADVEMQALYFACFSSVEMAMNYLEEVFE